MVVKDKANPIGKIRDILKDQNGILLTSDLLYSYARQFRIQKIVREYIEVLL
jgi:hypothetical protein